MPQFIPKIKPYLEAADEDPLLQEGPFERFSDRDPEGFPLTYPAWHKNSIKKKTNQRPTRVSNRLKPNTYVHETNTTQ